MSNWIDAAKQLPRPNTVVLVYGKRRRIMFMIHKSNPARPWEYVDGDTCREKITHWMPLPDPPEVKS